MHISKKKQYLCGMKDILHFIIKAIIVIAILVVAMWIFGISAKYLAEYLMM